ncbi:MAG: L-threonylcarbamoyladenylate synthase [Bernardetiaceae bacterium]|nr:L-threonylcarbamoyladenylate synthase [Bernardetiaceae bacterium]
MRADYLEIHPKNPEPHKIRRVVECLRRGGVIIYPTDTVYGLGCDLLNARAVERICRIKEVKPAKMHLSFICYDLSDLSEYARAISTPVFRVMKKALPGPFTFILEASNEVPKIFGVKKNQVGIRVPNHQVPRMIVQELGNPLVTTSVKDEDEVIEYMTDPSLMLDKFGHEVDLIIDSGYGGNVPSTVVDCIDDALEVVRPGAGDLEPFL